MCGWSGHGLHELIFTSVWCEQHLDAKATGPQIAYVYFKSILLWDRVYIGKKCCSQKYFHLLAQVKGKQEEYTLIFYQTLSCKGTRVQMHIMILFIFLDQKLWQPPYKTRSLNFTLWQIKGKQMANSCFFFLAFAILKQRSKLDTTAVTGLQLGNKN